MCVCQGNGPGFEHLDVWKLLDRVRGDAGVEFAVVHPQLCGEEGLRFWGELVRPGVTYVVGACDPALQRKMFKDALAAAGASFDRQVVALDLRHMATEEAAEKVAEVVRPLSDGR